MAFFVALVAVVLVLAFFLGQGRRRDEVWERYRERARRRRQRPISDEPPDPNFQFDHTPGEPRRPPDGSGP